MGKKKKCGKCPKNECNKACKKENKARKKAKKG
jgi:hypothetical protein